MERSTKYVVKIRYFISIVTRNQGILTLDPASPGGSDKIVF